MGRKLSLSQMNQNSCLGAVRRGATRPSSSEALLVRSSSLSFGSFMVTCAGRAIDKFLCCWRYSTTCWGSSYRSRCADSDLRDGSSRTRLRHWSHGHQLKHCRNDKVPGTAVKVSCSSQTGFSSTTEE